MDSLEQVVNSTIPLEEKKVALEKLADHHNWERPKITEIYLDSLYKLWLTRTDKNDSIGYYEIELRRAYSARAIGNYVEAIKKYNEIEKFFRRHPDQTASNRIANQQLATLYLFTGNYDKCQDHLDVARKIVDKNGSLSEKAAIHNLYASLLFDIDQTDKAFTQYKTAYDLYKEDNDTSGMQDIMCNMGLSYIYVDSLEQAEYHLSEYKRLLDAADAIPYSYGFYHDFMGYLRMEQKDYAKAEKEIKKAVEIRQNLHSTYNLAESKLSLGELYNLMGRYPETIVHVSYVLENQNFNNSLHQQAYSHNLLSTAYENLHDFKNALYHEKKRYEINDSILNKEKIDVLAEKDAIYRKSEDEKKIALLELDKERTLRKANSLRLVSISSIVGLLGLALFSWSIRRKNNQIRSQNKIIQQSLSEKDTLLREIHHRVKNNLQIVSSLLALQSKFVSDPKALQALNAGKSRVRSMALIHQNLYNKEEITGISAKDYIEKLIKELIITFDVDSSKINIKPDIQDIIIDVDTLIPLGLIINELLTNSLKYAFRKDEKGTIEISLNEEEDSLNLKISDDGIGFDPEKIDKNSFGYKLINTLLLQLNGKMDLSGNSGTTVNITIRNYKLV